MKLFYFFKGIFLLSTLLRGACVLNNTFNNTIETERDLKFKKLKKFIKVATVVAKVAAVVGTGGAAGGIIAKAHAIQKGISTAKKIYDVFNKAKKIKSIADKAKKAKNMINKAKKIKSTVSKIKKSSNSIKSKIKKGKEIISKFKNKANTIKNKFNSAKTKVNSRIKRGKDTINNTKNRFNGARNKINSKIKKGKEGINNVKNRINRVRNKVNSKIEKIRVSRDKIKQKINGKNAGETNNDSNDDRPSQSLEPTPVVDPTSSTDDSRNNNPKQNSKPKPKPNPSRQSDDSPAVPRPSPKIKRTINIKKKIKIKTQTLSPTTATLVTDDSRQAPIRSLPPTTDDIVVSTPKKTVRVRRTSRPVSPIESDDTSSARYRPAPEPTQVTNSEKTIGKSRQKRETLNPTKIPFLKYYPRKSPKIITIIKYIPLTPSPSPKKQVKTITPTTREPSLRPTRFPTTRKPTLVPTRVPTTRKPTTVPTRSPTTRKPTTRRPTNAPSISSIISNLFYRSSSPTINVRTFYPTKSVFFIMTLPTLTPTTITTKNPTLPPTKMQTINPTSVKTPSPTILETVRPTTLLPTISPTNFPTFSQTISLISTQPSSQNFISNSLNKDGPVSNETTKTYTVVSVVVGILVFFGIMGVCFVLLRKKKSPYSIWMNHYNNASKNIADNNVNDIHEFYSKNRSDAARPAFIPYVPKRTSTRKSIQMMHQV
jgi:hypothetical protein